MKKFMTGTMAIGLMFAVASCSSDSKSSSTTAGGSDVSTAASTAGTSTGDTGAAAGNVDTSGLDDVHAKAYALGVEGAASSGANLDPACFKALVAQLSAADAQLIVDAGPKGSPKLSAAGEALGAQVVSTCVPGATVTS